MRQFFITVIATIIGMILFVFLFFMFIAAMAGSLASKADTAVPSIIDDTVLSLDLRTPISDNSDNTELFSEGANSIVHIACALNSAKSDYNIKGLVIKARPFGMTPASAEELRLAIKDFKSSGKFVITHSQGFEGTSLTSYMAISASDEIWQQSASNFAISGISAETGFYGGVFEKFGAKAEFVQFHEYKNMANSYTKKGFTAAHKEAATALSQSIYDISMEHIAEDRGLSVIGLETLLDESPYNASDVAETVLVDKVGYWAELVDYIEEKTDVEDIDITDISQMKCDERKTTDSSRKTIAYIGGEGPILTGETAPGIGPLGVSTAMASQTLAKAIDDAIDNDDVEAIILRVSSPGGTVTGSDQIYGAVLRAKKAGIPVIISMGQYAASGGYYISAPADHILALPTTITGSIGVVGGKIALRDAYAKLGYNVERIDIGGDYLGAYSMDTPFSNAQRDKFYRSLENMYEEFTGLVAEGRDLPLEKVKEVAKGRVWTGAQAKEHGLVDSFGGIMQAIDVAKELAEINPREKIKMVTYPRPKTFMELLSQKISSVPSVMEDLRFVGQIRNMPEVQNALKARQAAELSRDGVYMGDLPEFEGR